MTAFMVKFLKEQSPAKLACLTMTEMQKWKGRRAKASIRRFLALTLENTSDLGGLPSLTFVKQLPRSTGSASAACDRCQGMECCDCDVKPLVINCCLKQEHVAPQDVHQLEGAVSAWGSFLLKLRALSS
jgi:hypothetical protein